MADIFISYAREDREWVEKLANQLVAEGFTVWWDWDLLVGKRYRETIETELQTAKAAVVVWSQHSIRSDFVRDEAEDAQQRNILLPLLKEIVRPPAGFRQLQTADLSNWQGGGEHIEFRRMLRGVSSLVGRPAAGDGGPIPVDPAHPTTHFTEAAAAAPPAEVTPPSSLPQPESPPAIVAKAPEPVAAPAPSPVMPLVQTPVASTPRATNPVLIIAAVGVVALIAIIYLAMQFFGSASKPPSKPSTPAIAAPAAHPAPLGMRPDASPTPPAPGGAPTEGTNGGGDDVGGDVGQSGPRHGGGATDAHPSNDSTDGSSDSGDTGQGNTH